MQQYEKINRVMEFRNHFKNEASLKSLMSKGNTLMMFFVIVISTLFFACTQSGSKAPVSKESNNSDKVVISEVKNKPVIVDNETTLREIIKKGDNSIIIPKGVTIRLNATILIDREITIEGEENAVIEGNNKIRLFYVLPKGTLTLNNLIIANGKAEEEDEGGFGGAITNIGWLYINDCVLKNNNAKYGGAIFNGQKEEPGGFMVIGNTVFTGNSSKIGGGAIMIVSGNNLVSIDGSSFENNSSHMGGAIYSMSSLPCISKSSFDGNKAMDGGAIYNSNGIVLLEGLSNEKSLFKNNQADNCGGAIYNSKGDLYLLHGYVLSGNLGRGGAVYNNESSSVNLLEVEIKGNKSDDVFNHSQGGKVIIEKSTVEKKSGNNFIKGEVDLSRFMPPKE